jgi:putative phage-type endonuclease
VAMAAEQLKSRQLTNAREMTREEWLESRRKGIGGSDCAAILGINQYKGALGVFIDKTEGSTFEGNFHTEFGNWMEPHIREEFPKRFKKFEGIDINVYEYPFVLQHPDKDHYIANIDGIIEHPEHGVGIIEIKTASEMQWKKWIDDEVPDEYYCQVQHYLNVTGLEYAYIVALVGKRLLWKHIPRSDAFLAVMEAKLDEFWFSYIIPKIAPAPQGVEGDTDMLKAMYSAESGGTLVELPELVDAYQEYKEVDTQIKQLEMQKEAFKQQVMQNMGTAEVAYIGDKKVTWKTVNRKGYEVKPTSYRSLRIG